MTPLLKQVIKRSHALLNQAELHFKRPMPEVTILFDLQGQTAGMVKFIPRGEILIRYNTTLLNENRDHFLSQTVPHEVAHVVAHAMNRGCVRPHGPEWQQVMLFFGAEIQRCHNYKVKPSTRRRLQQFNYHCGCREHLLTSIRHNRAINGQRYICKDCREVLHEHKNRSIP